MKKSIVFILFAGLISFALITGARAQKADSTKSKKAKIVMRIQTDKDGKTRVIDTVFNLSDPEGQKEFEEAMKEYEVQMEDMQEKLKNIEVYVDMADMKDSLLNDSLFRRFRIIEKDSDCPHFKWHTRPYEYSYDFDDFDRYIPGPQIRNFRFNEGDQTLSDLLGDIPMARVKSYVIKDRKDGKRIIIDIEDGPIIEKEKKMIIIREPGKSSGKKYGTDRNTKVIIRSGDDKKYEILKD